MPVIKFKDKKFSLQLSVRYNAGPAELLLWKKSFAQASKLLFQTTDKQIQFGEIKVCNDSSGGYFADAFLHPNPCTSNSDYQGRMHLCANERYHPFVIIHELGHYAFDLYDEYTGASGVVGNSWCSNDENTHRCIMEFSWKKGDRFHPTTGVLTTGKVREFCFDHDHHTAGSPTETNQQELYHKKGCWDAILDIKAFEKLKIPSAERAIDYTDHKPLVWTEFTLLKRIIVILDNSASMDIVPGLKGYRNGTRFLIEYLALLVEWFGMESSDGSVNPVFEVQQIKDKQTRDAAINALQTAPVVNQPDNQSALTTTLTRFQNLDQAVNQCALLLRSGADEPFAVTELIASYQQQGVRVLTVSADRDSSSMHLEQLTAETGGLLEYIPGDINDQDSTHTVQIAIAGLLDGLIDNTSLIMRESFQIPAPVESGNEEESSDRETEAAPGSLAPEQGKDQTVVIEKGAQRAIFIVNDRDERQTRFSVFRPDGRRLELNDDNVHFVDDPDSLFAFYAVSDPDTGTWLMRVERDAAFTGEIGVTTIAHCENKNLYVQFEARQVDNRKVIEFRASVWYGTLVAGLQPTVKIFPSDSPDDDSQNLPLSTVLQPVNMKDSKTGKSFVHNPGIYHGKIELPEPGTYTIVAKFANAGSAIKCDVCCDTDPWPERFIPPFLREARRQVTLRLK